jgi:hypothetical protein
MNVGMPARADGSGECAAMPAAHRGGRTERCYGCGRPVVTARLDNRDGRQGKAGSGRFAWPKPEKERSTSSVARKRGYRVGQPE